MGDDAREAYGGELGSELKFARLSDRGNRWRARLGEVGDGDPEVRDTDDELRERCDAVTRLEVNKVG